MLYGMQYPAGSLLLILLVLAAGCTSSEDPSSSPATPVPAPVLPTTESPSASVTVSDMALGLTDLPSDYILRDRSVMTTPDVTQLTRDMGWQQGYFVTFDRTGRIRSDQTRIRQSVYVFPVENIRRVYSLEKIAFEGTESMMASPYEIPFPDIGENSIAYRMTDTPESGQVTYTVLFTKKNVFERITMSGTSTDYETLKEIAGIAAEKIR